MPCPLPSRPQELSADAADRAEIPNVLFFVLAAGYGQPQVESLALTATARVG